MEELYDHHLTNALRRGDPRRLFILQRVLRWTHVGNLLPEFRLHTWEAHDCLMLLLLYHAIVSDPSEANVDEDDVADICGVFIRKSPATDTYDFESGAEEFLTHDLIGDQRQFQLEGQVDSDVLDEMDLVTEELVKHHRLAEAEMAMLRLISCREKVWGPLGNPAMAAINNLAMFYEDSGRHDDAERAYRHALKGYEKAEHPNQAALCNTQHNLGVLYKGQGDYEQAESMYRRALDGRTRLFGPSDERTLATVHSLGLLYVTQGRLDEAAPLWERYLEGIEQLQGPNHARTIVAVYDLGILYMDRGMVPEAIPLLERAVEGYERTKGPEDACTVDALRQVGTAYAISGRYNDTEISWRRALQLQEKLLGPYNADTIQTTINMGKLYKKQEKLTAAADMYERALEGYRHTHGRDNLLPEDICGPLLELYERLGRLEEAGTIKRDRASYLR